MCFRILGKTIFTEKRYFKMARTEYGLQMYSLRDITKDSMRMALEKVAQMSYKYVEFAGFSTICPSR